jgi:hypothetical protein
MCEACFTEEVLLANQGILYGVWDNLSSFVSFSRVYRRLVSPEEPWVYAWKLPFQLPSLMPRWQIPTFPYQMPFSMTNWLPNAPFLLRPGKFPWLAWRKPLEVPSKFALAADRKQELIRIQQHEVYRAQLIRIEQHRKLKLKAEHQLKMAREAVEARYNTPEQRLSRTRLLNSIHAKQHQSDSWPACSERCPFWNFVIPHDGLLDSRNLEFFRRQYKRREDLWKTTPEGSEYRDYSAPALKPIFNLAAIPDDVKFLFEGSDTGETLQPVSYSSVLHSSTYNNSNHNLVNTEQTLGANSNAKPKCSHKHLTKNEQKISRDAYSDNNKTILLRRMSWP